MPVAADAVASGPDGAHRWALVPQRTAVSGAIASALRAKACFASSQLSFRASPEIIITDAIDRACRELDVDNVKAKRVIKIREPLREALDFLLELFRQTENMAIVLSKLPQPKQSVKRATGLVPVHEPKLRDPQR